MPRISMDFKLSMVGQIGGAYSGKTICGLSYVDCHVVKKICSHAFRIKQALTFLRFF